MEKVISKETESDLIKLGLYQVVGGAVGLILILWSIYKSPLMSGLLVLIYLLVLLFFGYSILCGILCLKLKKNALEYSLVNQILQVVGFAMMGFAFKYVAGFFLTIGLNLSDSIKFGFGAGISKFDFNFNNERERFELDFNLIAFALIYWIDRLMKRVKQEITLRQINAIGDS